MSLSPCAYHLEENSTPYSTFICQFLAVKRTTCESNIKPNTEDMFNVELGHIVRGRDTERVNTETRFKNNTQSVNIVHTMCSVSTFIQVHTNEQQY